MDGSLINIPAGFAVGISAWHPASKREVVLSERKLGDGWICVPKNGDPPFYEHTQFLKPLGRQQQRDK